MTNNELDEIDRATKEVARLLESWAAIAGSQDNSCVLVPAANMRFALEKLTDYLETQGSKP